jgi:PAS domain S-box-containing protein
MISLELVYNIALLVVLALAGMLVLLVFLDHGKRRNEQNRLRENEAHLRVTLHSIGDAVISTDVQGQVVLMNPVAEALTGWTLAEALGQRLDRIFRIINEDTRQPVESPVDRVLRKGGVVGLVNHTLLIAKDGTERPIADSGAPIRGDQGQITGVVLVFRDQTEARIAENVLRDSERQFQQLFESMTSGFAVHELIRDDAGIPYDYRFLKVNPAFETITGLKADTVIGKTVRQVLPQVEPVWIERYGSVVTTGNPISFENYSKALDRHYQVIAYRPEPEHFAVIINDITARKQAEEDRVKLEGQLRQAQKMESVGRLAGGVAHDFNNMLMVISNYIELCQDELPPAHPIRSYLDEMATAARRSANLTRQLLAFARKETISPRALNLNDTVTDMLKLLRRTIGEDIELVWKPGAHPTLVMLDPSQADQLLANLCVNARDAIGGPGTVTIQTGLATLDRAVCETLPGAVPGDYILLTVSDNGCGMTKETLEHLFEPFFTTKKVGHGTGLGLATVYGIVKQNNGYIDVKSQPGQGSVFRIYLPHYEKDPPVFNSQPAPDGRGETA